MNNNYLHTIVHVNCLLLFLHSLRWREVIVAVNGEQEPMY